VLRISVITVVLAGKDDHLGATWESLAGQELPPGWELQWVLQEDGETGEPLKRVPADPRISAGMAPWAGISRARTGALPRADGVLCRAVDADDLLTERALWRDIEVLAAHPEIGWCVSPAIDLFEDGTTRRGPRDPSPGPIPAGLMAAGEREGLVPVVGQVMTTYTELVRLLGGWPAVRADDIGLLLAAEAIAPGWMQQEPGLMYRRWHKATDWHLDKSRPSPDSPWRAAMLDRVDGMHAAGWTWQPTRLPTTTTHVDA